MDVGKFVLIPLLSGVSHARPLPRNLHNEREAADGDSCVSVQAKAGNDGMELGARGFLIALAISIGVLIASVLLRKLVWEKKRSVQVHGGKFAASVDSGLPGQQLDRPMSEPGAASDEQNLAMQYRHEAEANPRPEATLVRAGFPRELLAGLPALTVVNVARWFEHQRQGGSPNIRKAIMSIKERVLKRIRPRLSRSSEETLQSSTRCPPNRFNIVKHNIHELSFSRQIVDPAGGYVYELTAAYGRDLTGEIAMVSMSCERFAVPSVSSSPASSREEETPVESPLTLPLSLEECSTHESSLDLTSNSEETQSLGWISRIGGSLEDYSPPASISSELASSEGQSPPPKSSFPLSPEAYSALRWISNLAKSPEEIVSLWWISNLLTRSEGDSPPESIVRAPLSLERAYPSD